MVLRKPYAFLIKNFKKINILLLALVIFIAYKDVSLYGFLRDYASTGIYNETLDSISNYINVLGYLALIFIFLISGVLAYLLKYKNKPYASYLYVLISNLLTFALFVYVHNYFNLNGANGYSTELSRNMMYVTLVTVIPYAFTILLLLIRSMGLDLKKFGFSEDKEFLETNEEDREEVEVEVAFDKDILVRQFKNKVRMLKYFFLEHKFPVIVAVVAVTLISAFSVYNYVYVYHKVYKMNQTFTSNNYNFTVLNTYVTDKDYSGNIISNEGRFYLILDLNIENLKNVKRNFDITKFILYVDNHSYVPDARFNNYFSDIGRIYDGKEIGRKAKENYILIYEIEKPTEKSNFLLTYQDLITKDAKTIRVRIQVRDLSEFVAKDQKKLGEEMSFPINLEEKKIFTIDEILLADSVKYTYERCYVKNCPIYEGTLNRKPGNKILRLKGDFGDDSSEAFIKFMKKYGKIKYIVNGETVEKQLEFMMEKNYRGKMVYLSVPDEINQSPTIDLLFTVRTYQYTYRIKGEE